MSGNMIIYAFCASKTFSASSSELPVTRLTTLVYHYIYHQTECDAKGRPARSPCCPQGHGHWCTGASPPLTNQTAFCQRKSSFSFYCPYGRGRIIARVQSAVTACGPSSSWITLPVAKTLLSWCMVKRHTESWGPFLPGEWQRERPAFRPVMNVCKSCLNWVCWRTVQSEWVTWSVHVPFLEMSDLGLFMHHSWNEYKLGLLLYHSWNECNMRRINYVFQVKVTMRWWWSDA